MYTIGKFYDVNLFADNSITVYRKGTVMNLFNLFSHKPKEMAIHLNDISEIIVVLRGIISSDVYSIVSEYQI